MRAPTRPSDRSHDRKSNGGTATAGATADADAILPPRSSCKILARVATSNDQNFSRLAGSRSAIYDLAAALDDLHDRLADHRVDLRQLVQLRQLGRFVGGQRMIIGDRGVSFLTKPATVWPGSPSRSYLHSRRWRRSSPTRCRRPRPSYRPSGPPLLPWIHLHVEHIKVLLLRGRSADRPLRQLHVFLVMTDAGYAARISATTSVPRGSVAVASGSGFNARKFARHLDDRHVELRRGADDLGRNFFLVVRQLARRFSLRRRSRDCW